jgi:apolipoprotein D and lipocalin family protein
MYFDIKRKSNLAILSAALVTLTLALQAHAADSESKIPAVTTVQKIDINQYAGKWYEIARLPMFFQRNCASDVTATYTIDKTDTSKIIVDNQCRKSDGKMIQSIGQAMPVDASNSKLQVTFLPKFLRWLPIGQAPYWILKIDDHYQTALVGNPEHKYLWILSRTPHISETTYQSYVDEARRQGFDVSKLQRTPQNIPAK